MTKSTQIELEKILEQEGLTGWKVEINDGSDGLCLQKHKVIIWGRRWTIAGFLHEVAHATTRRSRTSIPAESHDAIFADELTRLCGKHLTSKINKHI